jgi:dynein heavy chain
MALRSSLRPTGKKPSNGTNGGPATPLYGNGSPESPIPAEALDVTTTTTADGRSATSLFPDAVPETSEPKVMVPFEHCRGRVPRKIEVERRRRRYDTMDPSKLLEVAGLSLEAIAKKSNDQLPIEVFDDTSYETRNPQEWLEIARSPDNESSRFLPALGIRSVRPKSGGDETFTIEPCRVIDWNAKANQLRVYWGAKQSLGDDAQWIPRILVHLLGDDPLVFAQRLFNANEQRMMATRWIKYRLCTASMPTEGLPGVDGAVMKRIRQLGCGIPQLSSKEFPKVDEKMDKLCSELTLEWRRSHNRILLEHRMASDAKVAEMVAKSTNLAPEEIEKGPDGEEVEVPDQRASVEACRTYNFEDKNKLFTFATYYTQPEVVKALTAVRRQCIRAVNGSMFALPKERQMSLQAFKEMQVKAMQQMATFLKEEWKNTICDEVKACFDSVGKGWLNVNEKDQNIYEVSKLRKFFVTVKFMMEDTVFSLVYKSLEQFTEFFEQVSAFTVNVTDMTTVENKWPGSDAGDALEKQPLFTLELIERHGEFSYSTSLGDFEAIIIDLFDAAIDATRAIPQVEKYVMTQYFWKSDGQGPFLDTVKKEEERVCALRDRVRSCLQSSLAPLQEYLGTYQELLDIVKLDKQEYIKKFEEEEHSTEEMKEEIKKHVKAKKNVTARIPFHCWVGNYIVDCHQFRYTMAQKNQDLAKLVMDLICKIAKSKTQHIREEFHKIATYVQRKNLTVEKLYEMKNYIAQLPETIAEMMGKIDDMNTYYTILEGFQYELTNDESKHKWEAKYWPRKLDGILDGANKQLEKEGEELHEWLVREQESFGKEVDKLQRVVATFSKYTDSAQSAEVASQVKVLNKAIRDCVEKSRDFNNKQRLFGDDVTDYRSVVDLEKEFKPYSDLWTTTFLWQDSYRKWHTDPFESLNSEEIEQTVAVAGKTMLNLAKVFRDKAAMLKIVEEVQKGVQEFKPLVPIAAALLNPGMKDRHWDGLSEKLGIKLVVNETLNTMHDCYQLVDHKDEIVVHCEVAAKEYSIEKSLDDMKAKWEHKNLNLEAYKATKTFILTGSSELTELLDEHINVTQQLQFSHFKAHFAERIDVWEKELNLITEILEQWLECQRSWRYLEPIFSSEGIAMELPKHTKLFEKVDRTWKKIMSMANTTPNAHQFCTSNPKILDQFIDCNKSLEAVQKGLNDYLQDKRQCFPRFYFLSDEELLEILSQSKDPRNIDQHLKKLFEFMDHLKWDDKNNMLGFYSGEGEYITHVKPLAPEGNVEAWLMELQTMMKLSVANELKRAVEDYPKTQRTKWVLNWAGQAVLAASQVYWSSGAEESLATKGHVKDFAKALYTQLMDLVDVVQSPLNNVARINMGALITIEVHAKDTIDNMVRDGVDTATAFDWIKQLRFYFEEDQQCHIRQVDAHFVYGGEYLGNTGRLVVTPLTDRIYLTLTGALALCLGGAPAGPAGTGKTETTKDLAKALAKQCVVFNCQEGMTYQSMGKFFKGLAWSGAWACFDEFNRIDIEVLSVVAQQVTDLQQACITKQFHLDNFEGSEVVVDPTYAVFITMNPGYAGRTELPDNLKVLFRPVACMVPDYALIGEIRLFSYGYRDARNLAQKMVMTFKLSSEQLSSQDHYDFGMRAVNTVISAAGLNKRKYPNEQEDILLLRALRDSNIPKFLRGDIILFEGIISDLFPKIQLPQVDYGALMDSLRRVVRDQKRQNVEVFLHKCIQLYDVTILRHGLMLVGPTGSGKTCAFLGLQAAMTHICQQQNKGHYQEFQPTQKVYTHICNPKSITMDQLYGAYDRNTGEWNDGVLSVLFRDAAYAQDGGKHWVLFDGPVDALWIESMNTVLDENKKLCLVSGEIIQMSRDMTMMFEVEDLSEASPATVSRCGMIYMEPQTCVPTEARVQSWLEAHPAFYQSQASTLKQLTETYMDNMIAWIRRNCKEFVATVDNNLVHSFFNIFNGYITMFTPPPVPAGNPLMSPERADMMSKCCTPLFFQSLVWSVGASMDGPSRDMFNERLREVMQANNHGDVFPAEESVYDYTYVFSANPDDEVEPKWVPWDSTRSAFALKTKVPYSTVMVPTIDTIRSEAMISHLMMSGYHVAVTGPTGTGKTATLTSIIMKQLPEKFQGIMITFSAQTSANLLQQTIFSKLDKRRSHVYGAPAGKHFICFIDDANLPQREKYGAQPPVELLRQFVGQGGCYTYVKPIKFQQIIDVSYALSMGPPGGGRNPVSNRFLRFFNNIAFPDLSARSMSKIFTTLLNEAFRLQRADKVLSEAVVPLVKSTITVFQQCIKAFVPKPAHVHYTFNLRDVSRVFGPIYESEPSVLKNRDGICRMWVHEMLRVFGDRLISEADSNTFKDFVHTELIEQLSYEGGYDQLITVPRLVYGDYMNPNADRRTYDMIPDMDQLVLKINEYLQTYNDEMQPQMNLVMFLDAIEHVSRIARVLRTPNGHALLLGIGGSGRKSMTRLACFLSDRMELFSIEITKNFGVKEWREAVGKTLFACGREDKKITFLFSDTQIVLPVFLEDVASLLTSGDIPNCYDEKQLESINEKFKDICLQENLPTTKVSIYSRYIQEVRANLHVVIAFTPIGELYRTRMRMFPSLVNCCTIDWFSEWPEEALLSVAQAEIESSNSEFGSDELRTNVCGVFTKLHLSASQTTEKFFVETRRRSYITPTSYLSLLQTFMRLLDEKRKYVFSQRSRLENGLDKLKVTEDRVADLEEQLKAKQPELVRTQEAIKKMMERLAADKAVALEKATVARKEEEEASKKRDTCATIQRKCQDRLAEAEPALKEALRSLRSLKVKDVGELGNYKNPPAGVKRVVEAVAIMLFFGDCPKEFIVGPPGQKEASWWLAAKSRLKDPKGTLEEMTDTYDKEAMTDNLITKIDNFITTTAKEPDDFTPQKVQDLAAPCYGMCAWVNAMRTWFRVNKEVKPLRAELAQAEAELAVVTDALAETRAKLKIVEDNVAALEAEFSSAIAQQRALEQEVLVTSQKLNRAGRLIDGLGGEKSRWKDLVKHYTEQGGNIVGDMLIAAGSVAYFGPWTYDYRRTVQKDWAEYLDKIGIAHSAVTDLTTTCGNPVEVQQWQLHGLPSDGMSTENALILFKSPRWPLLIDPQTQGNTWIRNMHKDENLQICKPSDAGYAKTIEGAVRLGLPCLLENVGENLEPMLEPVLLRQTFMIGSTPHIKVGDSVIPYDKNFKFYITTKLPNPTYDPENCVKVSLLNFFITPRGLEDQLLGKTVEKERKDLEDLKQQLTKSNAEKAKELKTLQDDILRLLQEAEGDILEQETLINTLEMSKKKSIEINEDMATARATEVKIDETRNKYRPHAFRGSLLFFVASGISTIDPMYQFSLQWFLTLFLNGIDKAERSDEDLEQRIGNLKEYFTYSFYANVCRSLFERHKLTFSFYMCTSIIREQGVLNDNEFRFLMTGATSTGGGAMENPAREWLTEQSWNEIQFASRTLSNLAGFDAHVRENIAHYKNLFDTEDAHRFPLAGDWDKRCTPLQKLIVTRMFRMDKVSHSIQDFVTNYIGEKYIIVPSFNLMDAYKDSTACTPLIFIISPGSDPMMDLLKFADQMRMGKKLDKVSLGQGQGPKAEALIEDGKNRGTWVLLQNCHLATSWMGMLEQIVENFNPELIKKEFRLWLTSMPSERFPVAVLQIGVKMTNEPPKGLRANMTRSYFALKDDDLAHSKATEFKQLLFAECLFHGIIQERRRFGSLGFNIPYEFNDSDRNVCTWQLRKFLEMYDTVPFDVLTFLTGEINYGGRVTDDWDRRCMMTMINDYLSPKVLDMQYTFSPSGIYRTLEPGNRNFYLEHIGTWPINPAPEAFGLHSNADITSARADTIEILQTVLSMQAGSSSGSASSREAILTELAADIQARLPTPFNMHDFNDKYPTRYEDSMNTVLVQEAQRYNKLLHTMINHLRDFLKAIKGEVVMSAELEQLSNSMFINVVPDMWAKVAYPSMMPLSSWVNDLLRRCEFIRNWYENGTPNSFWIGGFFFPQAFLTGTLQNFARRVQLPIDTISFGFEVLNKTPAEIKEAPEKGAIVYGMYMEGARWSIEDNSIMESRPKELYTDVPPIFFDPIVNRPVPTGVYKCPCTRR